MPAEIVGGAGAALRRPIDHGVEPDRVVEMRIRSEFHELRGLALTVTQAARLFGIPRERCVDLLSDLVHQGFLRLKSGDLYALRVD